VAAAVFTDLRPRPSISAAAEGSLAKLIICPVAFLLFSAVPSLI
jgi:predicted DNA repair protein MutK